MTTKHTCGGPTFGRLAPAGSCPRCDELRAGSQPVRWANSRREADAQRLAAISAHDCTASRCGIVCTAFQW